MLIRRGSIVLRFAPFACGLPLTAAATPEILPQAARISAASLHFATKLPWA